MVQVGAKRPRMINLPRKGGRVRLIFEVDQQVVVVGRIVELVAAEIGVAQRHQAVVGQRAGGVVHPRVLIRLHRVAEGVEPRPALVGEIRLDGDDIYWLEQRPLEAGRYVVVRRTPAGATTEITPRGFNARTRVHEYGGGAYLVHQGTVYFANYDDQRLYRQDLVHHQPNLKATSQETALNSSVPAVSDSKSSSDTALGATPRPLTPAVDLRYADGVIDPTRGRMIAVREDHTVEGREAVNTIVAVNLQGDPAGGQVLVHGSDFYSNPRLSPDGRRLAWLQWNHPNMPWDGTELWVGDLNADGTLGERERVAGGMEESIFQPEWSARGDLYFISDRTGWWNLYRWHERRIEPMHAMNAEFGAPQWNFAQSTYALLADETGDPAERILCTYGDEQGAHLAYLDPATHALTPIETPYTSISGLRAARGMAVFMGGSPTRPSSIVLYDLRGRQLSELRHSTEITLDPGYLSVPQPIEFRDKTRRGDRNPPVGELQPITRHEDVESANHVVEVVQRFSHAHENNVPNIMDLFHGAHLVDNFGTGEITLEGETAGETKTATHGTSDLAGNTERVAAFIGD